MLAEGKRRGYDELLGKEWTDETKKVYQNLLRREPLHPAANRAMGRTPLSDYPDFRKVFRRMQNMTGLPAEFRGFRDECEDKIKTVPVWRTHTMSPEAFAQASALLDRFVAWEKKIRGDPVTLAIHKAKARIKVDPILGKYETVYIKVPPFVLFYASRKLDRRDNSAQETKRIEKEEERLRKRLRSYTALIQQYLEFFKRMWMDPLKLPAFREDQLFYVWVFGDRATWDTYGRRTGAVHPPGLLGYFDPKDHWVFLFEDEKERVTVESSLAHELTHQLHWHFSRDAESDFQNHFTRIKAVWLTEGWAEYAGWTKREGDTYRFGQTSAERVKSLRWLGKLQIPFYPIRELVKRESYANWLQHALLEWLPKQRKKLAVKQELLPVIFMELLYAQSWLLVNFLYEYKGGKYRAKTLKFTEATLRGYLGHKGARGYARAHEVFSEIFQLRTTADWQRFQKEYESHLETKLYEIK